VSGKEYIKILNRPEAKYRYWHIIKADRDFFPPAHELFTLKFNNKTYQMKINHKDDIMTGQLYDACRFFEGSTINLERKKNGNYVLTAEGTESW